MRTLRLAVILSAGAILVAAGGSLAAKVKDSEKPAPMAAAPTATARLDGTAPGVALPGVPAWTPPAEYSVDLVMTNGDQNVTMHRAFRNGSIRSDLEVNGESMAMIERADEPGTTYNLMPSRKVAMKMNAEEAVQQMPAMTGRKLPASEAPAAAPEETPQIEKVGTEQIDGHDAAKFKVTSGDHSALMWFDSATGAPLRMESGEANIQWKNLTVAPQSAKLFEVPKDYQLTDVNEQMKKLAEMRGAAGGMGGMVSGMMGMGGGGGAEGMAGAYGQRMGQGFGQQIGAGIGASFGGPLGAMAGQYIGGRVGGWIGRRAATAVTPNVGPGSGK